jgi:hypothetical protein
MSIVSERLLCAEPVNLDMNGVAPALREHTSVEKMDMCIRTIGRRGGFGLAAPGWDTWELSPTEVALMLSLE